MFDQQMFQRSPHSHPLRVIETSLNDTRNFGNAIYDFFALRKKVFVDALKWQIPHNGMVEIDQYDTITAKYVLILHQDQVVGGVRVLPVNAKVGSYPSMIGDALQRKTSILPTDFPKSIRFDNNFWEGTRLVVSKQLLPSRKLRMECFRLILSGIQKVLHNNQSTSLVTISAVGMAKLLPRYGLFPKQVFQPFFCQDDGREYAVFKTEFTSLHDVRVPIPDTNRLVNPEKSLVGGNCV